jgi:ATP adenylyltransferase
VHRLWTPWRMRYVGGERTPGCVFCNALAHPDHPASLVLHVGEHAFMLLNRFPYNSGHLMIVPKEHVPTLEILSPETRSEMFEMATLAIEAARPVFRCDGFNLGMNIGEIAGAGIADHLHMHLVPRWMGDANFMPVLGDTMVIPEVLETTHARLRAEINTLLARKAGYSELAAGALVYLPEREAFVLRRTASGEIVLPKGKIEADETAAEAAVREVREETGIDAELAGWLGAQTVGDGVTSQHIVFFVATGTPTAAFESHLGNDVLLVGSDTLLSSIEIACLRSLLEGAASIIEQLTSEDL